MLGQGVGCRGMIWVEMLGVLGTRDVAREQLLVVAVISKEVSVVEVGITNLCQKLILCILDYTRVLFCQVMGLFSCVFSLTVDRSVFNSYLPDEFCNVHCIKSLLSFFICDKTALAIWHFSPLTENTVLCRVNSLFVLIKHSDVGPLSNLRSMWPRRRQLLTWCQVLAEDGQGVAPVCILAS